MYEQKILFHIPLHFENRSRWYHINMNLDIVRPRHFMLKWRQKRKNQNQSISTNIPKMWQWNAWILTSTYFFLKLWRAYLLTLTTCARGSRYFGLSPAWESSPPRETKNSRMTKLWIVAITPCFCFNYFEDFDLARKCAKQNRMYRGEKIIKILNKQTF